MIAAELTTLTAEQQDFLAAYKQAVATWVASYKEQSDPEDPIHLFYTNNWDYNRMAEMPEQFKAMSEEIQDWQHRGLSTFFFDYIQPVTRQAEKEVEVWFNAYGYVKTFPVAPAIDHETPLKVEFYMARNPRYVGETEPQKGVQFGQVVVTRTIWQGEHKYTFSDAQSMRAITDVKFSGNRKEKKAFQARVHQAAITLSKLTDWSQFDSYSHKVRRSLGVKVSEIR